MATQPLSLDQFGATIKAKHPEYADIPNADLAQKVLDKYPQYKDMVQTTPSVDLSNKQGQGTYAMWDTAGHKLEVPYGQVQTAAQQGYKFDTNANKGGLTPSQQFQKDSSADPNYRPSFSPAAGDPRGSVEYQHQMEANAPLPIRVMGGVSKGAATLARPVADLIALGIGMSPQDVDEELTPRSTAERVAKYGTVAAGIVPAAVTAPVATAGAMVGGTVGGAAGQYAGQKMGLTPAQSQVLGDVGGLAGGAAGSMAAPGAARLAGRVALLGKTPEGAYESALKPSTTMTQDERQAAVKTGLENEIPVSKGGVEKINSLIESLNQKIADTLAADPNRPIDPNAVATRADAARTKFANQVNAQGDLNAIEASRQQFLKEQGAPTNMQGEITGLAPNMGAAQAQAMKQGTYRVLAGKYGEQGSAAVEAQKALARGLKEEIATQFPEISTLNASESKLLDLQPVLERAVNRISNHQLIGIGTPVAGAATEAVTGSSPLGGAAMVLKAVLDNPTVKSRLAIAVSKAQKVPYAKASAAVQAYSAALGATSAGQLPNPSDGTPTQ